jgi:hypothetical protein
MFGSFCSIISGAVVCSGLQLNAPLPPEYVTLPDGQVYEIEQLYKPFEGCITSQTLNSIDEFSICF